jgi:hypothetical protein
MPTQSQVHVDALLSNVSVAMLQTADKFVANRVFPDIPVQKQSDKYAVFPMADFNRDSMLKRADGTESTGDNFQVSNTSYFCDVFALHKDIGDQTRANADNVFAIDRATTEFLTLKALINKESNFISTAWGTGKWSTDQVGTADFVKFSDVNALPIKEIREAITAVHLKSGFRPNIAVMGRDVLDVLLEHPNVVNRVSGGATTGSPAVITKTQLASLFEVDEILVLDGIYNAAKEGLTASNSWFASDGILLLYRTPSPGMFVPNAGYTFSWSGFLGQAGMGTRINSFYLQQLRAQRIEIESAYDMKIVAADLGCFMSDVL